MDRYPHLLFLSECTRGNALDSIAGKRSIYTIAKNMMADNSFSPRSREYKATLRECIDKVPQICVAKMVHQFVVDTNREDTAYRHGELYNTMARKKISHMAYLSFLLCSCLLNRNRFFRKWCIRITADQFHRTRQGHAQTLHIYNWMRTVCRNDRG